MDYDILEKMNAEKQRLASHPALQKAQARQHIWQHLRQGQLKQARVDLYCLMAQKPVKKLWVEKAGQPWQASRCNYRDYTQARIAVFTIAEDSPQNTARHFVQFENADYILYCQDPKAYEACRDLRDLYEIRPIPQELLEEGPGRAALYMKTHPHLYLKEYDYVIYMEDGIRVMADIRKLIQYVSSESGLAMHIHALHDDVFQEASWQKKMHRSCAPLISRQMTRYKGAGFPRHFGLFDTSLYVCDLSSAQGRFLLDAWWKECLKSRLPFDQTALPFVLWENDVVFDEIGSLGQDIRRNPKLEVSRF